VPRAGHLAPIFVGQTGLGFTAAVVFLITGCICINIISGIGHELFTRIVLSSECLHDGPNKCEGSSEQYDAYKGVRHGFIYGRGC
jgi:hypothetical protein